jgi:hypothetical protein
MTPKLGDARCVHERRSGPPVREMTAAQPD